MALWALFSSAPGSGAEDLPSAYRGTNTASATWYFRFRHSLIEEREGEPLPPWRLHDLRRTLATNFQRLGVRFEVTDAVLNHVSGSRAAVAGVYQRHDWKDEKAKALDDGTTISFG